MPQGRKPKLAVWKFASCDGCQLALLDCERELLAIADAVDLAMFPEATRAVGKGPYDLSLVEGSITTPHDAERIHAVRRASRVLVAIGACATGGGLQALRNFASLADWVPMVYASPEAIHALGTSTPIAQHVHVDFELRGCPVNKRQLLEVVNAFLLGRRPVLPGHAVCLECKARGTPCVAVTRGLPCLGPITQAGCEALCPSFARGCFGCFGPLRAPAAAAMSDTLKRHGWSDAQVVHAYRSFHAAADAFRLAGDGDE